MEQKKALIIKVLERLQGYRELADGLLALVKSSYIDETAIDGLIKILSNSIKNIKNTEEKSVLQKGLEAVQRIRKMEESESFSTEELEEELDKLLEDI